MLEIPESLTIGKQADVALKGKTIVDVVTASSPHKFTFYNGDPALYYSLLAGKKITAAKGHGMFVDIHCNADTCITIGDGTNIRYYTPQAPYTGKHQLLLVFNDDSYLVFTVAMYGSIYAYNGILDNQYHQGSLNSISPLDNAFTEATFDSLFSSVKKDLSAKAFLATEQRIPGLGNGVLQDILFNARIHPKRKISTLSGADKVGLYQSVKSTLKQMTDAGGRDTEKDFYGNNGGYKTILSKNTVNKPCPICGDMVVKEAYLGGAIYFCPTCQQYK